MRDGSRSEGGTLGLHRDRDTLGLWDSVALSPRWSGVWLATSHSFIPLGPFEGFQLSGARNSWNPRVGYVQYMHGRRRRRCASHVYVADAYLLGHGSRPISCDDQEIPLRLADVEAWRLLCPHDAQKLSRAAGCREGVDC